jgi:hypothetical protein
LRLKQQKIKRSLFYWRAFKGIPSMKLTSLKG